MAATASCRILVISSTTDTGHQFVQRVKALSRPAAEPPHSSAQVASTPTENTGGSLSELHAELTKSEPAVSIPWTIANKYYTADVHFELRQIEGFAGYLASEVPAVIYVWSHGEKYESHVPELAKKLEHYDPEVSLAVRFASEDAASAAAHVEEGGEDGLDEFISSHGFEYVDGERGRRVPTEDGSSFSDEDAAGIPGLPRVIDALSTIMWPSIVQTQRTTQRKSRAGDLLDWASMEDASGGALLLQDNDALTREVKMQKEMAALENWLQEDLSATQAQVAQEKDHDDPWSTSMTNLDYEGGSEVEHGFDDDFDDFVGAPMDVTYGVDSQPVQHAQTRFTPNIASSSTTAPREYSTSFLTVDGEAVYVEDGYSAFGVEDDDGDENEDDDPDMPSRAEIEEMSKQLFGSAHLGLNVPSASGSWQQLHSPLVHTSSDSLPDASNSTGEHHESGFEQLDGGDVEGGAEDGEEYEMGAFDLSKVLGALQGMKEQIADMNDEGERRKAAAKVALGLVYGLQKEEEHDTEL